MPNRLRSHPHLYLREHLTQVQAAVDAIFKRHSPHVATEQRARQLQHLVKMHDLGKGSRQFQQYIADPEHYKGRKLDKSHTPLSGLLGVHLAKTDNWSSAECILAAVTVLGHHSRLFLLEDTLSRFMDDDIAEVLEMQLSEVDFSTLEEETGLPLRKLQLPPRPWARAERYLEHCWEFLENLVLPKKLRFRLEAQLLFSILLEADKAFLAIREPNKYLEQPAPALLPKDIIQYIRQLPNTPLNVLRQKAQDDILNTFISIQQFSAKDKRVHRFTITLPTGLGKTVAAARWALELREQSPAEIRPKRIILILPFLSILDQTEQVYRSFLSGKENTNVCASALLPFHSLSDRFYDSECDGNTADFFMDTWRSDIIVTTFDQLLLALFSPKTRHQMRFHNLCDAILIMDEVQTLPCILWELLDKTMAELERVGNTYIMAMSATQPGFLSNATELVPQPKKYFNKFNRYRLVLNHREPQKLEEFLTTLPDFLSSRTEKRLLLTFNTRRSARAVRDCLEENGFAPLYFISADVTPGDRLEQIAEIRRGDPCYVISTQCIEAGVDIDMDFVMRDFAPLDSLIQIAGRCNRNGFGPRAEVDIRHFLDENGRSFARMIYDPIHLEQTFIALEDFTEIPEEELLSVCHTYFDGLKLHMNLGKEQLEKFASWEDFEPIQELLRGKRIEQHEFIVAHLDEGLRDEIMKLNKENIPNRWERRRAWRKLAGRLARVRVAVYARPDFTPEDYAEKIGELYILHPKFYERRKGICLETKTEPKTSSALIL